MFDTTISLGNILTIGSFFVIVIVYILNGKTDTKILDTRLQMIDAQMDDFKAELKKLGEVLVDLAKQSGRIDRIEDRQLSEGKRIDELQRRFNKYANGIHDSPE